MLFTDDLWRMLNRCWETRPSVAAVLECLERVPRDLEPPSVQTDVDDSNLASDSSQHSNFRSFATLMRRIMC